MVRHADSAQNKKDNPSNRPRSIDLPHKMLVRTLKNALIIICISIIFITFYLAQAERDADAPDVEIRSGAMANDDAAKVINPRFLSRDQKERPFKITAATARKQSANASRFRLAQPTAEMTLNDGTDIFLDARTARYWRNSKTLRLRGDVTLTHERGFELKSATAKANLKAETVTANTPVRGHGPTGSIRSEGLKIRKNGTRIIFTGKSHLVINNESDVS